MHVSAIPREGETVAGHRFEETLDGGKATNQAVAAARLGAPVRFVSLVGDDERGRWVLRYLRDQGVDTRWVGVEDGPTDVGFVMLAPSGVPAIASCDDLSVRLDHGFVSQAGSAIQGASIVVCQLEAPPACAITAFTLARAAGARTLLNPAPAFPLPSEFLRLTDILRAERARGRGARRVETVPSPTGRSASARSCLGIRRRNGGKRRSLSRARRFPDRASRGPSGSGDRHDWGGRRVRRCACGSNAGGSGCGGRRPIRRERGGCLRHPCGDDAGFRNRRRPCSAGMACALADPGGTREP